MRLTRKDLNDYLHGHFIDIPSEMKNELLAKYGGYAEDELGRQFEYTEQDIYEQISKVIFPYVNERARAKYYSPRPWE